MARALLEPEEIVITGLADPTEEDGDPVDGHYFENGSGTRLVLRVRNAGASSHTLTIPIPGEVDAGIDKPDRDIVVGAGETQYVGPFDSSIYNQEDDPDTLSTSTAVYLDPDHADLKLVLLEIP